MDLSTALRILLQRWFLVLPTLLIVGGLGFEMVSNKPIQYQATGATLLLTPPASSLGSTAKSSAGSNPYASSDPALGTTANALAQIMAQPALRRSIEGRNLSADYGLTVAQGSPILTIQATARTRQVAIATVIALQREVVTELSAREDAVRVAPPNRIGVDEILVPTVASQQIAARNRLIFGITALGLAAAVIVAFAAESWASGRRQRRLAPAYPPPVPSGDGTVSRPVFQPLPPTPTAGWRPTDHRRQPPGPSEELETGSHP